MENPYFLMDDLGGYPPFPETPIWKNKVQTFYFYGPLAEFRYYASWRKFQN